MTSFDDLVVQYQAYGPNKQQTDTPHDQLVGHDASGHAGQHSSGLGYVVISPMQGIPCMRDCFPLPVQVLQYAHSQLLKAGQTASSGMAKKRVWSLYQDHQDDILFRI